MQTMKYKYTILITYPFNALILIIYSIIRIMPNNVLKSSNYVSLQTFFLEYQTQVIKIGFVMWLHVISIVTEFRPRASKYRLSINIDAWK